MSKIRQVIRKQVISPLQEFIHDSRAVGITLMVCTLLSLLLSNSAWSAKFLAIWNFELHTPAFIHAPHTLLHLINDGLMAVFFLLAGMEIKRELAEGELSNLKKAALPVVAALGGMLCPALLYYLANTSSGYAGGWGVPMATDIAFSLGILSLLGTRAPLSLKILLTALAIIDDLGAIVAIAVFYTDHISWLYLALSGGLFGLLLLLNYCRVDKLLPYFVVGIALWYCMFNSGIHATLAGVLLACSLPLKRLPALEHKLHDPVSFIILPLFALANTAIVFPENIRATLDSPINYGILLGLIAGKPLGIFLAAYIAVKARVASLPPDLNWKHILGIGLLAGIGFTMSIFIAMLAFDGEAPQITAKLAVLIASVVSGLCGFVYLRLLAAKRTAAQ